MFSFAYKNIDFSHKLDNSSSPTEHYYKHMHTFNEIIFFVKGNVDFTIESETRRMKAGDIVYIAPGKYHFATVDNSAPYERYVLKFPNSLIPEFIKDKLFGYPAFFGNGSFLALNFKQLDYYKENFNDEELYTLFMCETMKLIVMLCQEPIHASFKANKFIDQIIRYVEEHIREPISLDTFVNEFNFSKSYISNEFKNQMKIPIMHYVRSKKIIAAHQLILNGHKKSDVAEMFGFENYSTFYRAYQKMLEAEITST